MLPQIFLFAIFRSVDGCSGEIEQQINAARKSKNLKPLTCDKGLNYVARYHTWDQNTYYKKGGSYNNNCNMHSWQSKSNLYNECCYSSNHGNPNCMWKKPEQILGKHLCT